MFDYRLVDCVVDVLARPMQKSVQMNRPETERGLWWLMFYRARIKYSYHKVF